MIRRYLLHFFLLLVCILLSGCGGSDSSSENSQNTASPLLTLTDSFLKANTSHLSGTLTIYPKDSSSPLAEVNLLFAENGDGNITVSSPAVKLKKSTVYRFIVIFYWDEIAFAYVDTTQATGASDSSELTFSESLIVYNVSSNPDIAASISDGVLPNLDSDGDGYSNFEELRAGTDVNDENSVPDGPAIIWNNLTAGKSVEGTIEININAIDKKDGVASLKLINPNNINNLSSLPDKFVGNWNTTSVEDGDYTLKARATDTQGNVSESELRINISNSADRSGPEISFKVFQLENGTSREVNLNNNETVHDVIQIEASATDATAIDTLELTTDINASLFEFVQTPSKSSYQIKYDTTTIPEGELNLVFEARDVKGQASTKNLNLKIKNIPTILEAKINNIDIIAANPSTFTLSTLTNINIQWNTTFSEVIKIQKGNICTSLNPSLLEKNEPSFARDFNLSSNLGSGEYILCAYRTGTNLLGQEINFNSSVKLNINWDDDDDTFLNENDCGPLNIRSFPGNSRAYLMDDDYNCDNNQDINLRDATYSLTGNNNDHAGYSLSYGGDINGDGCNDILLGTQGNTDKKFIIYLIYGFGDNCLNPDLDRVDLSLEQVALESPDKIAGAIFRGEQTDDHAGEALQGAGDINFDGCDDFLIGAPYYDTATKTNAGRVYLIYGKGPGCNSTAYDKTYSLNSVGNIVSGVVFTGSNNDDNLGAAVSGLGDVNGDQKLDFGFSAPGYDTTGALAFTNAGAVYIATNNLTRFSYTLPLEKTDIGFAVYGELPSINFGTKMAYAGKFNQDNYDDFVVGAPHGISYDDDPKGQIYIIPGSLTFNYPLQGAFDQLAPNGIYTHDFPSSLSTTGDTNEDGFDDIMAGDAYGAHRDSPPYGLAIFLDGRADSMLGLATYLSTNNVENYLDTPTRAGQSVSGGANIDPFSGNGNEILIGMPDYNNTGATSISHYGMLDHTRQWQPVLYLTGENSDDEAGSQVSLYGGIAFDNALKTSTSPIPGDFNGDGCADPLIGAPNYGESDQGKVYIMLSGYCPQN